MAENVTDQTQNETKLFIGIEGGASFSKGILVNADGELLASLEGAPSTNFWLVGLDKTYERIHDMVNELKTRANIEQQTIIDALGCCLSGVKDNEDKQPFAEGFQNKYPNLVKKCISRNDTIGSIFSVSKQGGLVLIAGTGSNCFLLNPNGSFKNCGGWGHILGDQGGSFKLVQRAVKMVINEEDGLKKSPHDIENVKKLILDHYKIEKMIDILKYAYQDFDKLVFASVCKKMSELANNGDALAKHLFYLNGKDLARHINAVLPFADEVLLKQKGGLQIICIGSVFKSWNLLQQGFLDELSKDLKELSLVNLKCDSSIGAAFLAAKSVDYDLKIHSDKNIATFFTYKQ